MKKKIITVCAAVLFLTALGLTLYPLISNYVNQKYASEIQTAYQELIQQTDNSVLQEAKQRAIAYNLVITPGTADAYSEEALLSAAEDYDNQLDIAGNGIMGYVIIPKIQVNLVCYDIKELGKQLKKIGMLIVQDQVWNRVTLNREARKSTRYYIDEFHLLLKEEQTAAYSVEIWKRFRKWGGIPTGITQNVKDLLASREVENIFENSDYICMLNQAAGDRKILAQQLGISPHQLSYVTHSNSGEGLLFYGDTIVPFVDRFPEDTELYRLMTTKPADIKEDAKT